MEKINSNLPKQNDPSLKTQFQPIYFISKPFQLISSPDQLFFPQKTLFQLVQLIKFIPLLIQMTYFRLTDQTQYDPIKQTKRVEKSIQYELQSEPQIQSLKGKQQQCASCKQFKNRLKTIERFLFQMENKLIAKELILADKYKAIIRQLNYKTQQINYYKSICHQLPQHKTQPAGIKQVPHVFIDKNFKITLQTELSQKTDKFDPNTLKSTIDSSNRKTKNVIKKNTCLSSYQKTQKQNSLKQNVSTAEFYIISPRKSLEQLYKSQEIQASQVLESISGRQLGLVNKKNQRESTKKRDYELSQLRFENGYLKSYNSVLLGQIKQKTLASKVFLFDKK